MQPDEWYPNLKEDTPPADDAPQKTPQQLAAELKAWAERTGGTVRQAESR